MYQVIPGILEKEWSEIVKKIELVKPLTQTIHIDLLDGKFAGNTTFMDPTPFKKYSSEIFFELHMMVDEPIQYVDSFAACGFKRFLGHIEKMSDQQEFVEKVSQIGEVGLAVDGETSLSKIKVPAIDLDCLLIMTIKAGFSGQEFSKDFAQKIDTYRLQDNLLPLEVDGGINDKTIFDALAFGATRFVSTSYLFENPKENYENLCKIAANV